MKTDAATRARIAAMSAAESAFERDERDPFVALEQTSADAADALRVDPEMVLEIADEIVVNALAERLLGPVP